MFLSVLFDEGKSQLLWILIDELSFFDKDFGLHQDLVFDDFESDIGAVITFEDNAIG